MIYMGVLSYFRQLGEYFLIRSCNHTPSRHTIDANVFPYFLKRSLKYASGL